MNIIIVIWRYTIIILLPSMWFEVRSIIIWDIYGF